MVDIKEVAQNIYMIDDRLYSIPKWGSVYLINEEKKALVDTGPSTSVSTVLEGIKEVGVSPEEIDYLIVTHIHIDHAGGAGMLVKDMPRARVVVHERGARHVIDPTRLIRSFIATFGEGAMRKQGEIVPVEAARVMAVKDGDEVELSEQQTLRFIDAPGHAPHELCIHESRNGGLFSGDAIGLSVAEHKVLLPATPPPGFDLLLCLDTLQKLMALKATMIYFAHFGASSEVAESIQLNMDKLQNWDSLVSEVVNEHGFDSAAKKMRAQLYTDLEPVRRMKALYEYLTDGIVEMNVAGYMKYYQEKCRDQ